MPLNNFSKQNSSKEKYPRISLVMKLFSLLSVDHTIRVKHGNDFEDVWPSQFIRYSSQSMFGVVHDSAEIDWWRGSEQEPKCAPHRPRGVWFSGMDTRSQKDVRSRFCEETKEDATGAAWDDVFERSGSEIQTLFMRKRNTEDNHRKTSS